MTLRSASLALALAASVAIVPAAALAQTGNMSGGKSGQTTGQHSTAPHDMSQPNPAGAHNWNENQIVTATVHQAWQLAGRDENNFFEIVRQLAEISARNRNVTLPDDPAAGKRAGQYIRDHARADHDQLLYAIVDKAVQMTGKKSPDAAASSTTH